MRGAQRDELVVGRLIVAVNVPQVHVASEPRGEGGPAGAGSIHHSRPAPLGPLAQPQPFRHRRARHTPCRRYSRRRRSWFHPSTAPLSRRRAPSNHVGGARTALGRRQRGRGGGPPQPLDLTATLTAMAHWSGLRGRGRQPRAPSRRLPRVPATRSPVPRRHPYTPHALLLRLRRPLCRGCCTLPGRRGGARGDVDPTGPSDRGQHLGWRWPSSHVGTRSGCPRLAPAPRLVRRRARCHRL